MASGARKPAGLLSSFFGLQRPAIALPARDRRELLDWSVSGRTSSSGSPLHLGCEKKKRVVTFASQVERYNKVFWVKSVGVFIKQ